MSPDRPDPDVRDTDQELRSLLRRGDPAGGDTGTDPAEIARMRRTVLAAVASSAARPWGYRLAWTAAVAALAVAMVAGGRALWESSREDVPPRVSDTSLPGDDAPGEGEEIDGPGPAEPATVVEEPAEVVIARAIPRPEPEATPAPPPEVMAAVAAPGAQEVRQARQIQITAPGGTRIIWTLDPEFKL